MAEERMTFKTLSQACLASVDAEGSMRVGCEFVAQVAMLK